MNDYEHLKKLLNQYNELRKQGYNTLDSGNIIIQDHNEGYEKDEYQNIILLYKGKYILLLTYTPQIMKGVD